MGLQFISSGLAGLTPVSDPAFQREFASCKAKSQPVKAFLEAHKKVHLHFTPTYSSWLNQVELWFSKIERDVIARGIFTSLPDLKRKLMRYIRHYNQTPKTVKWKYFDPTRRITSKSAVTVHY